MTPVLKTYNCCNSGKLSIKSINKGGGASINNETTTERTAAEATGVVGGLNSF